MLDIGTSTSGRISRFSAMDADKSYPERRKRLHDCVNFKVPADVSIKTSAGRPTPILTKTDLPPGLLGWPVTTRTITARSSAEYQGLLKLQISLLCSAGQQIFGQYCPRASPGRQRSLADSQPRFQEDLCKLTTSIDKPTQPSSNCSSESYACMWRI